MPDFNDMQNNAIQAAIEMQKRAVPPPEQNFCKNSCPFKKILSSPNGDNDNDIMLLLSLLLMLFHDGGDKMLIFALIYIMT